VTSGERVVLVVGPPLAGVGGVVAALRTRLPHLVILDGAQPRNRAPDAVLGVFSAATPLTSSDWLPVEQAAARTELLVGVVTKVDAHRGWREVLRADQTRVTEWSGRADVPWLGVAAAPDLGAPCVEELVALLTERLAAPRVARHAPAPSGRPPSDEAQRGRTALARLRLGLLRAVRDRSAALRSDLREAASAVPAGGSASFQAMVAERAERFVAELDAEITTAVAQTAIEFGRVVPVPVRRVVLPEIARIPSSSRSLEGRLMTVLGVGFGLGIALATSRLLSGLAPGLSFVALVAGAGAGAVLVAWVVRARGLLHDRALLDRWVTEVAATLRWHGEAMLAERLLDVESGWSARRSWRASDGPRMGVADGAEWTRDHVTDQYR
jgi:hypothetical protein